MKYLDFAKLQSESAAMNQWPLIVNDPAYQTPVPLFEMISVYR